MSKKKQKAPSREKGKEVIINDKIKIFPDQPLEKYTVGTIQAFAAKELKGSGRDCYALLCDPGLMPRIKQATRYQKIANQHMSELIEGGIIYWPAQKRELYAFIYDHSPGKPIVQSEEKIALSMSPLEIKSVVLPALVSILLDCYEREFFHGNIRLSNLHTSPSSGKIKSIMLGDSLVAPYGYHQPVLYQTIQTGMADPIAKGMGTNADDIYAVGVCLALMLRHSDPMEGKSDNEILLEKIKHGSYAAITGKDRFTGAILELLRGVLHDDPRQRWNIEEVLAWVDGVRLSPKQHITVKNAPRPLLFNDKKFNQIMPLAFEISLNKSDALKILENDEVVQWLARALDEKVISKNLSETLSPFEAGSKGKDYEEQLISSALTALTPQIPIHYKSKKIMPDGMGATLAQAIVKQDDLKTLTELFSYKIIEKWLSAQTDTHLDTAGLMASFDACQQLMKKTKIGFGIERCVYVLNPQIHCLSPILKNHIVYDPPQLLLALDDIAAKGGIDSKFIIDRHMAAFLQEREQKVIGTLLYDMDSSEDYKKMMATLLCLASIQTRYKMQPLHHLSEACAKRIKPVYARYHDTNRAEDVQDKVENLASKGQLNQMAKMLSDQSIVKQDKHDFELAVTEYAILEHEHKDVQAKLADKEKFSKSYGGEVSAVVCSIICIIVTIIAVVSSFSTDTFF